jgi:hypothetical protein
MSDADEFLLLAERYEGLPVLKSDSARGFEARYADANELIEENAAVRIASAFWHELKATPWLSLVRYRDTTYERQSIENPQRLGRIADVRRERLNVAIRRKPTIAARGGRRRS